MIIDISEIIDENEFTDSVHVSQNAKEIIAENITSYIVNNNLNRCIDYIVDGMDRREMKSITKERLLSIKR